MYLDNCLRERICNLCLKLPLTIENLIKNKKKVKFIKYSFYVTRSISFTKYFRRGNKHELINNCLNFKEAPKSES